MPKWFNYYASELQTIGYYGNNQRLHVNYLLHQTMFANIKSYYDYYPLIMILLMIFDIPGGLTAVNARD